MHTLRQMALADPMQLVWPLATFAIVYVIGLVVRRLVLRALRAWTDRTGSRPGLILTDALRGPMMIWAVIVGLHLAIQASSLPPRFGETGSKTLLVLWIVSLTLMGMRLGGNLVRYYGDQVPGALPVTTLTQTLVQLAVFLLGVLLALTTLNFRITPILTALGVGGLAVALALQDTLSNLFSGFYVAVARQIRPADYIKLNSGEEGYVADIGWRNTTLRTLNNNLILVPNAKLAQAIVTNYHLPDKRMSAAFQVNVSHTADPDRVERILLDVAGRAAAEVAGILAEPAPAVAFDPGFMDSGVGFTVSFHIGEFADQFGARNELRKRIYRRFREEGIAMAFPVRNVLLDQGDAAGQAR
jgi:small-conductance mechanosensitive channel